MEDTCILELYFDRNEAAIEQTDIKYRRYCEKIADNILGNKEDSMECIQDTYLAAWNTIPPKRPQVLRTYLGRLIRNISLNRFEADHAKKRGGGQLALVLDELQECIPYGLDPAVEVEMKDLTRRISDFLKGLPTRERAIFLRRYWYTESVTELAKEFNMTESNIKVNLHRTRKKLRNYLVVRGLI